MTLQHQFGGSWSQQKLTALEKYLKAYITIFSSNPNAKKLVSVHPETLFFRRF